MRKKDSIHTVILGLRLKMMFLKSFTADIWPADEYGEGVVEKYNHF